jgi:glycosyltransferase involved in cell wall biosynthesis
MSGQIGKMQTATKELLISESCSHPSVIRVLALVEANTVHGPAKNLLNFCRISQQLGGTHLVEMSLAPFERPDSSGASNAPNEFLEEATQAGIPVHSVWEDFRFDPRVVGRLRRLVEQVDPHVIQTHHSKSHFLVRVSGVWKVRPWIGFHHGHTRSAFRLRIYQGLDHWSLRAPARVVTVSRAFAGQLAGFGVAPGKITVIHNAVELGADRQKPAGEQLSEKKRRLGFAASECVVLSVGRLSIEKDFPNLVRAIAQLRALHPEIALRLVLLGEGSERYHIENVVRSAGLLGVVTMPGRVRDVSPYYEIADVMAISSLSEGSPNVLLEAMAAGVPVVGTAVGGIPEIVVDSEHAILVPPGDPSAMAQAIGLVLGDPAGSQKRARAARGLLAAQYSPGQRARSLVEVYQAVYEQAKLRQSISSASRTR